MKFTTLCYIEKDDRYLMMHRTKKENDANEGKWIGIGGHFLQGESPEDCLLREAKEETGLTLTGYRFRGIVTFVLNTDFCEYMCLFTSDEYEGTLTSCEEGELLWVSKKDVGSLNLWEGDKVFLSLLADNAPFFSLKLVYNDDTLIQAVLDGKEIKY